MKATTNSSAKRAVLVLVAGLGLGLLGQPDARAHTIDYRPGYVYVYPGYVRVRHFPYWLRRDRGFQHWYWHSRYRFKRQQSWHRLYHIYLGERHYGRYVRDFDRYHYRGYHRKRRH